MPDLLVDKQGNPICFSETGVYTFSKDGIPTNKPPLLSPYNHKPLYILQNLINENNTALIIAYNATANGGIIAVSIDLSNQEIIDSYVIFDDYNAVADNFHPNVCTDSDGLLYANAGVGPVAVFSPSGVFLEAVDFQIPQYMILDIGTSADNYLVATVVGFYVIDRKGAVLWEIPCPAAGMEGPLVLPGDHVRACGFLSADTIYMLRSDGKYEIRDTKSSVLLTQQTNASLLCNTDEGFLAISQYDNATLQSFNHSGRMLWDYPTDIEPESAHYFKHMGGGYFDVFGLTANQTYEQARFQLYPKFRKKLNYTTVKRKLIRLDKYGKLLGQWWVPDKFEHLTGEGLDGEFYGVKKSGSGMPKTFTVTRLDVK
jgi:hypothetical protein